ncbi:hypothetical protein [Janthinobacterium sp. PSPC1-1]|uniref:hypothetical protein n=1 Tax=Janthinobacterium sp. PSPC1-1 TaxID=2804581 RepID=UPI003CEA0D8C
MHQFLARNGNIVIYGGYMRVKINFLITAMLFVFCADDTSAAQSMAVGTIAKAITGSATPLQRRRVEELVGVIVNMSQRPESIVLANIIEKGSANFSSIHCVENTKHGKSCYYTEHRFPTSDIRFNALRTFTFKEESDGGAEVTLEIAPKYACIPNALLSKVWGEPSAEEPVILPDFFAGSQERPPVKYEAYRKINPEFPDMYVVVRSIDNCVISIGLSAIQPPIEN